MQKMTDWVPKVEALLRFTAVVMLASTACLVGLDSQTKVVMYVRKTASFRALHALEVVLYIDSVAAAYNLLQLGSFWFRAKSKGWSSSGYSGWTSYLLDQLAVYAVFAGNTAAVEHSILVVTGAKAFQWTKWCYKFRRFCIQMGGALACGYAASFLMFLLSSISAFRLFRLYSPLRFLALKPS